MQARLEVPAMRKRLCELQVSLPCLYQKIFTYYDIHITGQIRARLIVTVCSYTENED